MDSIYRFQELYRSHPLVLKSLSLYINLLEQGFNILFCWIPGHDGIVGNEKADIAAKSANAIMCPFVSVEDISEVLKSKFHTSWQNLWNAQTNNKLRSILNSVKGFKHCNFNRKTSVRLITGHTYFIHRHLLYSEPVPVCSTCNVDIFVRHILTECAKYNNLRLRWFSKVDLNLSDLLGDPPHPFSFEFIAGIGFINVI
ncbi:hypothetical protein AVEN_268748-1 [Araneus ventricosus]|uniref:RNase H type-1 domain-containing protein n=1 Tax=Araneus ventricosus TaxID=182803 RepID=A0A4Y2H388_ARAVE|nr:hypothetical protein AVEN_268748-1 [Araneus ventricosus]